MSFRPEKALAFIFVQNEHLFVIFYDLRRLNTTKTSFNHGPFRCCWSSVVFVKRWCWFQFTAVCVKFNWRLFCFRKVQQLKLNSYFQRTSICLTTHALEPNAAHKAVAKELEIILCTAVNKCLEDGAKPTAILNSYLAAGCMSSNFVFKTCWKTCGKNH